MFLLCDVWDLNWESSNAGSDLLARGLLIRRLSYFLVWWLKTVVSSLLGLSACALTLFMWLLGLSQSMAVVFQEHLSKKHQAEVMLLLMN